MNFTDIVSSIIQATKRPDKINDIRREVNAAVLWFSTEHDYSRDVEEVQYPLPIPGAQTVISIGTVLPRFRKIAYIKIAGTLHYIKELDSIVPSKTCDLRDKWYLAGNSINVNMSKSATALDIAYYAYPPHLTDASPNYWMLDGNWQAILERALSTILNDIGDAAAARNSEAKAKEAGYVFRGDYNRKAQ